MRRIATVALLAALVCMGSALPASAGGYTTISGSGSTYAAIAIDQWANDVSSSGLTVNYNPDGSASGRADFENGSLVEFTGSDPPFRNGDDELGHTTAESPNWDYSYVPDVAGGLAFIYHLTVAGHLVTNLRLSQQTLMEIFTGQITNWSDPRITHDYGARLPSEPIVPVVRSDGSGESYFLSRWMEHQFPSQWDAFCNRVQPGIKQPCPQTEFYPKFDSSVQSLNGSNAVTTYVTASYGEGSIGYVEYGYALNAHWPVVAMENAAGYDVLPTASNVAVALTKAVIDPNVNSPDYLQQNLDSVYTFTDPRTYPLSSYSYLIVPRVGPKIPRIFNNSVGRSLSTFINYYLCAGQKQAAPLGYSPLPINLVEGAFKQVNQIPGTVHAPNINYNTCGNPTFINGHDILLEKAPYPSPCQKATAPLNCVVRNGKAVSGGPGGSNGGGSSKNGSTGGTGGNGGGAGSNTGGTSGNNANGNSSAINANITGSVQDVGGNGTDRLLLAVLTAVGVLLAVAAPPTVAVLRRRKGSSS
jgi:ABC-type phosphate transport system substrate-binding protein